MQKWEYLEVVVEHGYGQWYDSMGRSGELVQTSGRRWLGGLLNELGAQGWELIGVEVLPVAFQMLREGQYPNQATKWIFKRPSTSETRA